MRVVVFFICLCLLTLRGYDYIYTTTHHTATACTPVPLIEKAHYSVIKDLNPDKEEEFLITDEVEDEDTSNSSARKYILLASCYLALPGHLSYLHSGPKTPPAFCHTLSYKYITQGVLRI